VATETVQAMNLTIHVQKTVTLQVSVMQVKLQTALMMIVILNHGLVTVTVMELLNSMVQTFVVST
jgi:hypothetical protein